MTHVLTQRILLLLFLAATGSGFAATADDAKSSAEAGTTPPIGGKIYRTKDEHGRTVFTDQAPENAQEVQVNNPMTFPAGEYARDYERVTRQETAPNGKSETPSYTDIRITFPENGSAIRQNDGNITLEFVLSPGLRSGHTLSLVMDGAEYASLRSPEPVQMPNLDRGTHQVHLQITDAKTGKVIQQGDPVSFTVLRHSVLH